MALARNLSIAYLQLANFSERWQLPIMPVIFGGHFCFSSVTPMVKANDWIKTIVLRLNLKWETGRTERTERTGWQEDQQNHLPELALRPWSLCPTRKKQLCVVQRLFTLTIQEDCRLNDSLLPNNRKLVTRGVS
jgi:hypothetical protein